MAAICAIDHIENKHSLHYGKDSMENSFKSLREFAKTIIDFEKITSRCNRCYICRKRFIKNVWKR